MFSHPIRGRSLQGATLKFVSQQLYTKAAAHKNPKVLQEAALWFTRAGADFGVRKYDGKWAITTAKALLAHTNAGVRTAGIDFAVMLHAEMGVMLEDTLAADLKPATMTTVREAFAKANGAAAPAPTKQERAAPPRAAAVPPRAPATGMFAVCDISSVNLCWLKLCTSRSSVNICFVLPDSLLQCAACTLWWCTLESCQARVRAICSGGIQEG